MAPATEMPREIDSDIDSEFEELYRSSRDDVYSYVAGLLRDRSAAEDVTAAAFERAYRKRSRFDARRGTRRAWLFGIARNAALDELRRRRRLTELEAEPADDAPAPDEQADVGLRRAALHTAMAGPHSARARAGRAEVLRRPHQRRDRRRPRRQRVQRRHPTAPHRREAEEGLR